MAKFFKRLTNPLNIQHHLRKHVTRPVRKLLGIPNSSETSAVDEANDEANRQEELMQRQLADQNAQFAAQQAVTNANAQAEQALAEARKQTPIDETDVVLGGEKEGGSGFNFRSSSASSAASSIANAARKARQWFKK